MTQYQVLPISAFSDNYIWLLYDSTSRDAWVVDPGDAAPVIKTLKHYQLHLKGILITHHHPDHTGGIQALVEKIGNISIVGSHLSPLSSITQPAKEHDEIDAGFFKLKVLEIPGHTLDHIAFYNAKILFCGDTLFSFGCGRVFEGTPAQMFDSLNKLSQLPDDTLIYCGHEYTLANLQFAQRVEPNNIMLTEKINIVKTLREKNTPTLPSLLSTEKALNPFLRCHQAPIISATELYCQQPLNNPVDTFSQLREWKNAS